MHDEELRSAILRILARWDRLPASDILERLTPVQLVRFREETLRDLAADGLVEVRQVGDEPVVIITERGRRTAAGVGQPL